MACAPLNARNFERQPRKKKFHCQRESLENSSENVLGTLISVEIYVWQVTAAKQLLVLATTCILLTFVLSVKPQELKINFGY